MAADSGHRSARYIRVFVSSTFSDLVREREALQAHVFQRLRVFCRQRGWRFEAIDLRWGVSREAGLDQRTMQICLHEIESCRAVSPRPNFIVLLGERYGWRPLPEELPRALFERIRDALDSERRALLEWRDDQQEGSRGWYRLDSNALVGRAGGHDVERGVYVLQPRTARFTDSAVWARAVEEPLMEALSTSADRASAIGQSATEQEIRHGALAIPDARDHVLCFQRRIVVDAFEATGADPEGGTTHRAAGLERRRDFVGHARDWEAIGCYRRGDGAKTPFAVVGPAGSGKSALLAWAAEETRRERREAVVIERYIGATVDSLLPSVLLGGLVAQIDRAYGRDPRSVSSDPFEAADAFAERLELAREDRPLALFIDGVDRLQVD
jgi:hypothetical protein